MTTKDNIRLIDLKVVDTMTNDPYNLHRPVSKQAQEDEAQMEAIRQWREAKTAIDFAGPEPYSLGSLLIAALVVGALFLLIWNLVPGVSDFFSIVIY